MAEAPKRSTRNDITGDAIRTRTITDKYRDNYDAIFGKKSEKKKEDKHSG